MPSRRRSEFLRTAARVASSMTSPRRSVSTAWSGSSKRMRRNSCPDHSPSPSGSRDSRCAERSVASDDSTRPRSRSTMLSRLRSNWSSSSVSTRSRGANAAAQAAAWSGSAAAGSSLICWPGGGPRPARSGPRWRAVRGRRRPRAAALSAVDRSAAQPRRPRRASAAACRASSTCPGTARVRPPRPPLRARRAAGRGASRRSRRSRRRRPRRRGGPCPTSACAALACSNASSRAASSALAARSSSWACSASRGSSCSGRSVCRAAGVGCEPLGLAAQPAQLLAGGGLPGLQGLHELLGAGRGGLAGRAVGAVRAFEELGGAAADLVGQPFQFGERGVLGALRAGLLGAQVGADADLLVDLGGRAVRLAQRGQRPVGGAGLGVRAPAASSGAPAISARSARSTRAVRRASSEARWAARRSSSAARALARHASARASASAASAASSRLLRCQLARSRSRWASPASASARRRACSAASRRASLSAAASAAAASASARSCRVPDQPGPRAVGRLPGRGDLGGQFGQPALRAGRAPRREPGGERTVVRQPGGQCPDLLLTGGRPGPQPLALAVGGDLVVHRRVRRYEEDVRGTVGGRGRREQGGGGAHRHGGPGQQRGPAEHLLGPRVRARVGDDDAVDQFGPGRQHRGVVGGVHGLGEVAPAGQRGDAVLAQVLHGRQDVGARWQQSPVAEGAQDARVVGSGRAQLEQLPLRARHRVVQQLAQRVGEGVQLSGGQRGVGVRADGAGAARAVRGAGGRDRRATGVRGDPAGRGRGRGRGRGHADAEQGGQAGVGGQRGGGDGRRGVRALGGGERVGGAGGG